MHKALPVALVFALAVNSAEAQTQSARLFISGHSLVDRPIPDMLEAIAAGVDRKLIWNRQHIDGSSIQRRSHGTNPDAPNTGYSDGLDRDGQPIDALDELATASPPYDVLLITEWHRVLDAAKDQKTVAHLLDFHDRFIAKNPSGRTYFYAPWADLSDKADPRPWIAYEQAASSHWECVTQTANAVLAEQSRPDRIDVVPAAAGLAALVEHLNTTKPAAFGDGSPAEITASLFTDNVHLTRLGAYFISELTYARLFPDDPAVERAPGDLDPAQAAELRGFARKFIIDWQAERATLSCDGVSLGLALDYAGYMQITYGDSDAWWIVRTPQRLMHAMKLWWHLG